MSTQPTVTPRRLRNALQRIVGPLPIERAVGEGSESAAEVALMGRFAGADLTADLLQSRTEHPPERDARPPDRGAPLTRIVLDV